MWLNNFTFNETYAAYYGDVDSNDFHHHAVTQIVVSSEKPIHLHSTTNASQVGQGFIVHPLVVHKIECLSSVSMIYLEPQSAIRFNAQNNYGMEGIEQLPKSLVSGTNIVQEPMYWVNHFMALQQHIRSPLDHRLVLVFDFLNADPAKNTISAAANMIALSETRLRSLVKDQVGIPLVTWLLWRKLNKSVNALIQGATLVESAMIGGFSDQAHFTRTMKRMLGITPRVAAKVLNQE